MIDKNFDRFFLNLNLSCFKLIKILISFIYGEVLIVVIIFKILVWF